MDSNNYQFKFLMSREEAAQHWQETRRDLGDWLKEIRREQRLSIVDVADSLSLSIGFLDDAENGQGKLGLDRLMYLCRFYGIKINISVGKDVNIDYDRSEEIEAAAAFRATQKKEADYVR